MKTTNAQNSGWILESGRELHQFAADPKNYKRVPLELMIETDGTLAAMRDWPVGTEVARFYVTKLWQFIVRDDGGNIVPATKDTRHET